MRHDNVIVVGAGPTGLVIALGLARAGVDVTVLECEPSVVKSPRAIHVRSVRVRRAGHRPLVPVPRRRSSPPRTA